MKLFGPGYYKKFKCIADKCRHNCCIGWEIDVDDDALSRFRALGEGGRAIVESIDFSGESPFFALSDGRCPHLDERGLCKIITCHGEEYLCDICREHPRFYNFPSGRCEVGLGAACEEAARLILSDGGYAETVEISDDGEEDTDVLPFDAARERRELYKLLSIPTASLCDRIGAISERYSIAVDAISDLEWRELLSSLEYLREESRALFVSSYSSYASPACEEYAERALAYFVYRHASSAETEEEFAFSVGLAIFLERLFASLTSSLGSDDLDAHVLALRRISEELEYSEDNTEAIRCEFIK